MNSLAFFAVIATVTKPTSISTRCRRQWKIWNRSPMSTVRRALSTGQSSQSIGRQCWKIAKHTTRTRKTANTLVRKKLRDASRLRRTSISTCLWKKTALHRKIRLIRKTSTVRWIQTKSRPQAVLHLSSGLTGDQFRGTMDPGRAPYDRNQWRYLENPRSSTLTASNRVIESEHMAALIERKLCRESSELPTGNAVA